MPEIQPIPTVALAPGMRVLCRDAEWLVVPRERTTCPASEAEEEVYAVLARLRAAGKEASGGGRTLLQYGLYKAFLSSPEACRRTVERRLERLRTEAPEE